MSISPEKILEAMVAAEREAAELVMHAHGIITEEKTGARDVVTEYDRRVQALLIGLAISTSVAMILPISTPPNAIASSTGLIETKDMAKVGIILGVVGLVLGYGVLIFVGF